MRRRPMKTFAYETPELAEADFGKFVQGASGGAIGQAEDNDQETERL